MHRDIVYPPLPKDVQSLGSSPKCELHGLYQRGNLITVQGHPEFDEEIMREIVVARHALGIFTPEIYEDAMSRLGTKRDGDLVGQVFLKFLLMD